jgi:hypothetical protein
MFKMKTLVTTIVLATMFAIPVNAHAKGGGDEDEGPAMILSGSATITNPTQGQLFTGTPEEEILITANSNHRVTITAGSMSAHDIGLVGFTVQWSNLLYNGTLMVHDPELLPGEPTVNSETLEIDSETGKWEKTNSLECTNVEFVDYMYGN